MSAAISVALISCHQDLYNHEYVYSVEVRYANGDKDTVSGKYVITDSETAKPSLGIKLGSSSCLTIVNVVFNVQRLACDVRSYQMIEEKLNTIKLQ